MNYLVTCDRFFLDAPGGGYRIAWELARAVRGAGHHVALLCGSFPGDGPHGPSDVEGVNIVRYRFPNTFYLNPARQFLHFRAAKGAATRWLSDRQWDVIHSHMPSAGLAAFSALGQGSRRFCTVHSLAVLEQRLNWIDQGLRGHVKLVLGERLLRRTERRLFSLAHNLHVLSDFTKQTITSLHGDRMAPKIQTLPWWHDSGDQRLTKEQARQRLGWPLHKTLFLTLRRMVPRMGLDIFLSALEHIVEKHDFTAVLAGDGPERPRLMRRVSTGRLADRVIFTGRLPETELPKAYQAADAFVLPTIALEGFGIIILEAWANGCPVLASRVGAIPELLAPISPQCLVDPADHVALSALLEQVITGELSLPSASQLTKHVRERYGREVLLPQYFHMLQLPSSIANGA